MFFFRILECCTKGNKENLLVLGLLTLQHSFLKQWKYFIIYGSYKKLFPPDPINELLFITVQLLLIFLHILHPKVWCNLLGNFQSGNLAQEYIRWSIRAREKIELKYIFILNINMRKKLSFVIFNKWITNHLFIPALLSLCLIQNSLCLSLNKIIPGRWTLHTTEMLTVVFSLDGFHFNIKHFAFCGMISYSCVKNKNLKIKSV